MPRHGKSDAVPVLISPKDQDFSRFLPRNLSYIEGGAWDPFSVSVNFVRNPPVRIEPVNFHLLQNCTDILHSPYDLTMTDMQSASVDEVAETFEGLVVSRPAECVRQNSNSDTGESEEGVFFNMLDDLDSLDGETVSGRSICSDDFAVDSINSPDEDDQIMKDRLETEFSDAHPAINQAGAAVADQLLHPPTEPQEHDPHAPKTIPQKHTPSKGDVLTKQQAFELPIVPPVKRFDTGLKIAINDVPLPNVDSEKSIYELIDSDSPLYEDREFNFTKTELRKSTSLKTNKTPPGTPHRKKVVRFADAMGLDLESVRHILNMDSPPKIPSSAMKDLQAGLVEDRKGQGSVYLAVTFPQPGASYTFVRKVLNQKVCLENALVTDLTITGFARVSNVGFHKIVRVRYTINNWESFYDIAASYVQNSCDGPTDRFSFSIVAPSNFITGSKLQFAVSYTVNGECYWDSNSGKNYVFECFAKTIPTENDNSWMHFL